MPPTTSHKRKLPFAGLQRRVRARREEPEPEPEEYSDDDSQEEGSEDDDMSDGGARISDESDSASGSEDEDDDDDGGDDQADPSSAVSQISFGALAKAQTSMPNIRKKKGREVTDSADREDEEDERRPPRPGDSRASKRPPIPQRASKHAPTEMSSKRQVTRRREVVSVQKVAPRDPRFSSASGTVDEARARKAYAFLDEYRDAEMAQLKAAVKKSKNAGEREALARELKSMQSRKEAQARRDAEQDLVARHRRQEKDLVAQGKKSQPFYLKKSEQKRQLLLERFAGMKKKDVDRTIERRRKKLTARERRSMPVARRDAA
ncbi:hypothetical protein F5Y14DRAFT_403572 [Nemania sp. NC0429]|nr:hypothetical protein F5Y14DRAFT_403572 [Nemania sp. NC0429]